MTFNSRSLPQPWTPQQDVDEALAYSDPIQQNRAAINEARNQSTNAFNMNPWGDYFALLKSKNARLNPNAEPAEDALPAGYTQGQLDTENQQALTGGVAPRWAGSQNLPSSQRRIGQSLEGLNRSIR